MQRAAQPGRTSLCTGTRAPLTPLSPLKSPQISSQRWDDDDGNDFDDDDDDDNDYDDDDDYDNVSRCGFNVGWVCAQQQMQALGETYWGDSCHDDNDDDNEHDNENYDDNEHDVDDDKVDVVEYYDGDYNDEENNDGDKDNEDDDDDKENNNDDNENTVQVSE